MKAFRDMLGIDEFRDYLDALGYGARMATEEETARLGGSGWGVDRQCIALDEAPFDLVWIRLGGAVGPRQNLKAGAFRMRVGPVPVMSNQVLPLQFHYCVWGDPGETRHELRAKLRMRKKGFWNPEITDVRWTGGRLASLLDRDTELAETLRDELDADESLHVKPHPGSGSVRIVHGCTRTINYSLFSSDLLQFHQRLAPPELVEAIGTVAERVRSMTG